MMEVKSSVLVYSLHLCLQFVINMCTVCFCANFRGTGQMMGSLLKRIINHVLLVPQSLPKGYFHCQAVRLSVGSPFYLHI